jgi:hypothetical protein
MLFVCLSGIIRSMGIRVPLDNCETHCVCSETKCITCKQVCFGNPVKVIWQNVSCAFIGSQVCVTVVGLTTNKQPVQIRKEGKRQPLIVVLDGTMVQVPGKPVPSVPALYPLPPSSRRLPCLFIIKIIKIKGERTRVEGQMLGGGFRALYR